MDRDGVQNEVWDKDKSTDKEKDTDEAWDEDGNYKLFPNKYLGAATLHEA